jgi:hypothetical protein
VIADRLENQFTSHDLCGESHAQQVETTVQALLASISGTPLGKVRSCDIHNLADSLKLRNACGLDGIPNECLRDLPRRPLVHLTHLFNHCLRLSYLPKPWKEAKVITLPKPGKDPKFPQNLRSISLLSATGKLFEKIILKIVQRYIEAKGLLNASHFGFRARHNTTFQCMRLTDHLTLNFNNNMTTAAVFLDIENAFDKIWHIGLLYKLSELTFLTSLITLINSFLSQRKFRVSIEDELSSPRNIQAGVPQGSVLSPTLYSLFINDTPQTPGVYLGLFADDTCILRQTAKRVMFSESCSEVSGLL